MNHYDGTDCRDFESLERLSALSLASPATKSLLGVPLTLHFLGLYNAKKLTDLGAAAMPPRLAQFELNNCRNIRGIDCVASLPLLRELHFCDDGPIASLSPIRALVELRVILFYGSTDISDGDLSLLMKLPQLQRVAFADRSHYSHRMTEVGRHIEQRPVA